MRANVCLYYPSHQGVARRVSGEHPPRIGKLRALSYAFGGAPGQGFWLLRVIFKGRRLALKKAEGALSRQRAFELFYTNWRKP
jgi:hypothetical protein